MIIYYFLFFLSVFLASIAQILLKISANKVYLVKIDEYFNRYVIFSYFIFFICTILTIISFNGGVLLKFGPVIESSQFIFVLYFGYFILKEKLTKRKIIGAIVIIIGIIVFSLEF